MNSTELICSWDYYAGSIDEGNISQVIDIMSILGKRIERITPLHGCDRAYGVFREVDGRQGASVQTGGHHGARVLFECHGPGTDAFVGDFRIGIPEHKVSRCDVAIDNEDEGLFERTDEAALGIKRKYGLIGYIDGDWDHPELGRTRYLGSRKSEIRVRTYEKGKEPEYIHANRPNWIRSEIQFRPRVGYKELFASISPDDVWKVSKWTSEFFSLITGMSCGRLKMKLPKPKTDFEMRFSAMLKQYGRTIEEGLSIFGTYDELFSHFDEAGENNA